jgi:hypothetical protein
MKHRTKNQRSFTGLIPVLICIMAVGGLLFTAQPASATASKTFVGDYCMQKIFGTPVSGSNKLNCTANDIRISRAISATPTSCVKNTTFDLVATFEVIVNANARYDAGFFFRVDAGANARGDGTNATGECSLTVLTLPGAPNPPALNLDGDTCGDLNSGTYNITMTIPNVLCQDTNGNGKLNLPNCTSWHSNSSTSCNTNNAFTLNPETKSKCVCDDTFEVPVTVEDAHLTVDKSANPTTIPEPGGTVTYTVKITNTASVESVAITSIADSPLYGDLGNASNSNVTDNTCPSLINTTLAPGATVSCSFKGSVSGNATQRVTDTVEACSYQASNNATVCGHDSADVDITDVYTAPTLAKTAQSTANCQLDVTYQVVVSNNSTVDTLTVNSLNDDKFGNIAAVHTAGGGFEQVVSTTCGQGGQGMPGALPATIQPSGNYTCSFVGRIASSSCAFDHTNKVTAGTTDDDGTVSSPYDTATVTVTAPTLH